MEKQIGLTRRKLLRNAGSSCAGDPADDRSGGPDNRGAGNICHAASARQPDLRRQHGAAARQAEHDLGLVRTGRQNSVEIAGKSATGMAGADRRWQVKIRAAARGGPYTVKIIGRQNVELHNVLVGDVWLCGGQSNMEVPLRFAANGDEEVKAANYPGDSFLRGCAARGLPSPDIVGGTWKVVSPETADAGFRRWRTTLRAGYSRISTFPSAWSWMPSAERRRRPGRARRRCNR